jgi:hypothetical protein
MGRKIENILEYFSVQHGIINNSTTMCQNFPYIPAINCKQSTSKITTVEESQTPKLIICEDFQTPKAHDF